MKSKEHIKEWLQAMVNKYHWLRFEYEFSKKFKTHYIAVFPFNMIENNEEYCKLENDFYDDFKSLFPDHDLVFGNEYQNFKLSDKAIEFSIDTISESYSTVMPANCSIKRARLMETEEIMCQKESLSRLFKVINEIAEYQFDIIFPAKGRYINSIAKNTSKEKYCMV